MDKIFDLCVEFLLYLAKITGLTYNEINVWIFVILGPIFIIILIAIVIKQFFTIKKLKK